MTALVCMKYARSSYEFSTHFMRTADRQHLLKMYRPQPLVINGKFSIVSSPIISFTIALVPNTCFCLFSNRVGRTDPENDKDGEDVKGNCGKEWVGVALGVAHHWWGAFTYCYMEISPLPFVFSFVFSFNFFTFFTSKYISSSLVDAMP